MNSYNYLLDKTFLNQLAHECEKTIYVKIISYDIEGKPQSNLEGIATGGTINIDGSSSVRRSCSLSFINNDAETEEDEYFNFYWSLSTQFQLFIGLKNTVKNSNYPDILWFPQGWYLISSFNKKEGNGYVSFNISGKDKMCRLNGELGGTFTALTTDLGKSVTYDGQEKYNTIKDIIVHMLSAIGGEQLYNILITDLDDELGLELLEYRGDTPLYLFEKIDIDDQNAIELCTVNPNQTCYLEAKLTNLSDPDLVFKTFRTNLQQSMPSTVYLTEGADSIAYHVIKLEYGEIAGYKLLNADGLVYAGDLIANLGESITSVLDKIIAMLGHYEYFYNIYGQFVFQKKKNQVSISLPASFLTNDSDNNLVFDIQGYNDMTSFSFSADDLIFSKNQTYNLNNIKNDFAIWGKRNNQDIYLRYAIDQKPTKYITYNYVVEGKEPRYSQEFNTAQYDWREIIYQMAYDYMNYRHLPDFYEQLTNNNSELVKNGLTGYEKYYTDIYSFWRDIYDPNPTPIYTPISYEKAVTLCPQTYDLSIDADQNYNISIDPYWINISDDKRYYILNDCYTDKITPIETKLTASQAKDAYVLRSENDSLQLIKWIDLLDFSDEDFDSLYYMKDGQYIKLLNSLNLIYQTKEAYYDDSNNHVYVTLFDYLMSSKPAGFDPNKVFVSKNQYAQKYPYQEYVTIENFIKNIGIYDNGHSGSELYVLIKNSQGEIVRYSVESIQLSYNDGSETLYIWYIDEEQSYIPQDIIEMLIEANKNYKSSMIITYKDDGESMTINGYSNRYIGLELLASRNTSGQIMWYETDSTKHEYEYFNLYSITLSDDIKKEQLYFYYPEKLNQQYFSGLELLNIDKSQVYIKTDVGMKLYYETQLDSEVATYYFISTNEKMSILTVDDELIPLFYNNSLQELFYYPIIDYQGQDSKFYVDINKNQKIHYYQQSYAYNYNPMSLDYKSAWNLNIYKDFNQSKFWFDLLDKDTNIQRFSAKQIGNRIKTIHNERITGIDYNIPQVLYITNDTDNYDNFVKVIMPETQLQNYFVMSRLGHDALDEVSNYIDQLLKSNTNVSISNVPLYWLDANQQVFMDKYYEIKRITIPLAYNGKMTMELIPLE